MIYITAVVRLLPGRRTRAEMGFRGGRAAEKEEDHRGWLVA